MASKIDAVMSTSVALDTLKASSSLNTLAKAVRGTTSAWKSQEAQMKSSGDYLEASKAKYEGLGKSIEAQKAHIAAIQDKMKDLDQTTQEGAKQAVNYGIDLSKATTSLKSMEAQQERAKTAMDRQKSGIVDLTASMNRRNSVSDAYVKRLESEGNHEEAVKVKRENAKKSIDDTTEAIKKEESVLAKLKDGNASDSAIAKQRIQVEKLKTSLNESKTSVSKFDNELKEINPSPLQKLKSAVSGVNSKAKQTDSIFKKVFSGVFWGEVAHGAATTALNTIKAGFGSIITAGNEFNKEQQVMNATWTTLTGSAKKGEGFVDSINKMSTAFGQSNDLVNELDQQFYHVLDKKAPTEQLTKSVLTMADTLGMSAENTKRLGLNFTHMMSSSKMQVGDFNMISDQLPMFGEQLLKYEQKAQKNQKLTMSQLRDQMSAGKISAKDAENVMNSLGKKYKGASENMMKTASGAERSIKARFSALSGELVKPFTKIQNPIFGAVSKWVSDKKTEAEFSKVGTAASKGFSTITTALTKALNITPSNANKAMNSFMESLAKSVKDLSQAIASHAKDIVGFFKGLWASVKILGSIGVGFFKGLAGALTAIISPLAKLTNKSKSVKGLSGALESLSKHNAALQTTGKVIAGVWAAMKVGKGVASTIQFFGSFSKGAMAAAKASGKMTKSQTLLAASQKALNLVMNHNVFAIVVTSIIALGAAFVALYKHNKKFRDFINGIAKDASKFFKGFKKSWDNFWNGIGSWFSNKWNSMSKTFNNFIKGFNKLWNSFSKGLQKVWNAYWNGLGSWFSRKWNSMSKAFNNFTKGFNKLWNSFSKGLQKVWNAYWNGLFNFYKNIFNAIIKFFSNFGKSFNKSWTSFKNGFGKSWSSHWNAIKNFFGDIANAMYKKFTGWTSAIGKALSSFGDSFKRAWSDIGNAVKGIFSGLWKEMKSLAHNGMKAVVDVINKAIGGINGVIHLFGGKATTIDPIKFATGTGSLGSTSFRRAITKITPAIVNDEAGAANPELIFRKATGSIEYNKQPNAHTLLFPGDEVANATDSAKLAPLLGITHFAGGGIGDFFGGLWSGVTGFVSDVSKKLKQLWETGTKIVSDPAKALTSIMGDAKNSAKGFFPTIVKGGFNKTKDQAGKWWDALWSMVNLQGDSAGSYGGGWQSPGSGWVHTDGFGSPRSGGVHDGNDFSASIGSIFHAMHGGTVIRVGAAPAGWGPVGYNIVTKDSEGKEIIYQEFGNAGDVKVHVGQHVKQGDVLGRLGRSGLGTGPHLHVGLTNGGSVWSRNGMSTNGWLDITKQHGKDKGSDTESDSGSSSAKADSKLQKLAKNQVGSGFWKMIEKLAGLFGTPDDSGTGPDGSGTNPQPTGSHKNWLKQAGIPKSQYGMYTYIINHESGWNPHATNPSSGAYGIPQSLPASKLASAGSDWKSNPITQIKWMKGYVNSAYGGIKNAYDFWLTHHAYANGGIATMPSIFGEAGPEMAIPLSASRSERASQLLGETVIHLAKNNPDKLAQQTSNLTNTDLSDLGKKMDLVAGELATMVQLLKLQISATKAGFDQNTLYRLEGKAQALADFQAL